MFIVSIKPNRRKILLILCTAVLLCGAVGLFFRGRGQTVWQSSGVSVSAPDNARRITFLKQHGWCVKPEPCEISDVAIPMVFGSVYQKYNQIQKTQGFDLEPFRGKKIKRYTYEVTNYPDHTDGVHANLLVSDDTVIGGDICSVKLNGFMHGFSMPAAH